MTIDIAKCFRDKGDHCKMSQSFSPITGRLETVCRARDCGGRNTIENRVQADLNDTPSNRVAGGSSYKTPRVRGRK